ncbi:arylamine N-acetyltransferase family protein [Pseudonocardia spinosispora]|uniref:arylamine N-acetyltransferase family protein n=1 Tax=Pseudonocardia spinosispora TaxID=103441 RepID=UPI0004239D01|nr:arylamine N-acetyltransferase [Pseudonocardia spinosispora]
MVTDVAMGHAARVLSPGVSAYFRRIGLAGMSEAGPSRADRGTLERIVAGHTRSIAYENLDTFAGREVLLDAASLTTKLVHGGRGGGCYEHNMLLRAALDELGYTTVGLGARVWWNEPDDAPVPARSHMLLLVDLPEEGPHIVDVGSGMALTGVLRLDTDVEQATPHEAFRLLSKGSAFLLEVHLGAQWRPLYQFDLAEQYFADYVVNNWYNGHHPDSPFVNELLVGRPDIGFRYALSGSISGGAGLAVHHVDGRTERRALESPAAVRAALEERFLLDLSGMPDLDAVLSRMF